MTGSTPYFIAELISKSRRRELTNEEQTELHQWISADSRHAELWETLKDEFLEQQKVRQMASWDENAALERFWERYPEREESRVIPIPGKRFQLKWVAAVLILITAGAFWWLIPGNVKSPEQVVKEPAVIQPGKSGAVLTLADGTELLLDSAGNGVIAAEKGAQAVIQNGKLIYKLSGEQPAAMVYNTMTTPKGRQFQVTLPDGTRAWLNAASSLRYPIIFSGKDRVVEVTGEVYFEVAKDKIKPFIAVINKQIKVEVLGTSFNINAYLNEPAVKTTLLDGAVRVASKVGNVLLTPGKQAQVDNGNTRIISADTDKVMAWKNGLFNFEGASLKEIMRQLERWYDIEVVYAQGEPDVTLNGKMTRDVSLNGLLRGLNELGLHTKLEGRTLTILQ